MKPLGPTFRRVLLLLSLAVSGPLATSLDARTAPSREYQIKAVFLFNFLQFVEWPETAFADPASPGRIGVLRDDPFGQALDDAVRGEPIGGRPLVVRRSRNVEDLQDCHLLFLSRSETRRADEILARLDRRPVLTVSEIDGFARHGGVIAFYPDGKKVRFEINSDAARRQSLRISSQLLDLGRIVGAEPSGAEGGRG